jgi:MoaA/NifB/PqqE/SkfB family radical SAM enzyme
VARAQGKGAKLVVVQTNGLKLAEPGYLEKFKFVRERLGWGFSIHAASEAINRIVTGRSDSLAIQWQALRMALETGFGVMVTYVATRHSLSELCTFVEQLAPLVRNRPGFHSLHIAYPIPNGNAWGKRENMPSLSELALAMQPMLLRADELGVEVRMSESCALPRCLFHTTHMVERLDILDIYGNVREINPSERRFAKACDACGYRRECAGIWHRYLDHFGEAEFVAVPESETRWSEHDDRDKGIENGG